MLSYRSTMGRAATGFLAVVFAVTAGTAGAALHLCGMEGLVQRTCCCHESEQAPPAELKGADDCCAALMSQGEHPAAAMASAEVKVDAPMLALAVAPSGKPHPAQIGTATQIPVARGSPRGLGPPLFVLNCSYLN